MKKKMKKSFLLPLIGIIAVITIVGVGFAAWTLISPINIDDATGNITAEQLIDRTFTINATASNPDIHFGKTDVASLPTDSWFRDDSSVAQNLETTLTITLTPTTWDSTEGVTADKYLEGRKIKVILTSSNLDGYNAAAASDKNYLKYPELTCGSNKKILSEAWTDSNLFIELAATDFSKSTEGNFYTATVTVTFAWGSATNFMSPYAYFNQKADGADTAKLAYNTVNTTLANNICTAVYALNGSTYTVSFEAVAKQA